MQQKISLFLILIGVLFISACGQGSSSNSSSGSSPPSGFTSDQRDKFNSLTPEGKAYVKQQMDAYDRATKR